MAGSTFTRRSFLRTAGLATSAAAMAACGGGPAPTSAPAEEPASTAPAPPPHPSNHCPSATSAPAPPLLVGLRCGEAPSLAAKVAAGRLPPVEERLRSASDRGALRRVGYCDDMPRAHRPTGDLTGHRTLCSRRSPAGTTTEKSSRPSPASPRLGYHRRQRLHLPPARGCAGPTVSLHR